MHMDKKDHRYINMLSNQFKREADHHMIGSPYRIHQYISYRLKGKSEQESLRLTKESKRK